MANSKIVRLTQVDQITEIAGPRSIWATIELITRNDVGPEKRKLRSVSVGSAFVGWNRGGSGFRTRSTLVVIGSIPGVVSSEQ